MPGPGRSLEASSDASPRGMTVHDRTRLIGRLTFSLSLSFKSIGLPIACRARVKNWPRSCFVLCESLQLSEFFNYTLKIETKLISENFTESYSMSSKGMERRKGVDRRDGYERRTRVNQFERRVRPQGRRETDEAQAS